MSAVYGVDGLGRSREGACHLAETFGAAAGGRVQPRPSRAHIPPSHAVQSVTDHPSHPSSTLAASLSSIGALPQALAIAGLLRQGNNTVLAPSNSAFQQALNFTDQTLQDPSALNATLLFNVISYHVLKGN